MDLPPFYIILFTAVAPAVAVLTVDIGLIQYDNPSSTDCSGKRCNNDCNNRFYFCLRNKGDTGNCTARLTSDVYEKDLIDFTLPMFVLSKDNPLKINNQLQYSSVETTDLLELVVEVTNVGEKGWLGLFSSEETTEVDVIIIKLPTNKKANLDYGPETFYGLCGKGHMKVNIRITSDCPLNFYGPECDIWCEEVSGQTACNYLGDSKSLIAGYVEEDKPKP